MANYRIVEFKQGVFCATKRAVPVSATLREPAESWVFVPDTIADTAQQAEDSLLQVLSAGDPIFTLKIIKNIVI